jgi:hypothetical protein
MKKTAQSLIPTQEERECRCHCGNLLARLRNEGVELKCRRCKRTVLISWGAMMWDSKGENASALERSL